MTQANEFSLALEERESIEKRDAHVYFTDDEIFLTDFNVDQVFPARWKTRYRSIHAGRNDFDPPSAAKVVLHENRATRCCARCPSKFDETNGRGKVDAGPKNALWKSAYETPFRGVSVECRRSRSAARLCVHASSTKKKKKNVSSRWRRNTSHVAENNRGKKKTITKYIHTRKARPVGMEMIWKHFQETRFVGRANEIHFEARSGGNWRRANNRWHVDTKMIFSVGGTYSGAPILPG